MGIRRTLIFFVLFLILIFSAKIKINGQDNVYYDFTSPFSYYGGGWGANSLADSNSVFTPDFLTLILNGSSKYGYKNSPNDVDLNSANYIADSNSIFTGTVTSDYTANGNTSISFASDKMQIVNTSSTSSDYVSLSQDNFSSTTENGKNYTIQLDMSSKASSDYVVELGNMVDTITTTGTETAYAFTQKYDSSGMMLDIRPFDNDNYWTGSLTYVINRNPTEFEIVLSNGYGLVTSYGLFVGKTYKVSYSGTTTSNEIKLIDGTTGGDHLIKNISISDGVFNGDAKWTSLNGKFYIRCNIGEANFTKLTIEELPSLKIYPLSNDTLTVDNVDVSEAYDLEIEGWVNTTDSTLTQRILSFGNSISNRVEILVEGSAGGKITFYSNLDGSFNNKITTNKINKNKWTKLNITIKQGNASISFNNITTNFTLSNLMPTSFNSLYIGRSGWGANSYFNGQIGWIKLTRTDGLGNVTGYSYYNWQGDAAFLTDKGTSSNDLTGVDLTTADIGFKSTTGDWEASNGILTAESDSTLSFITQQQFDLIANANGAANVEFEADVGSSVKIVYKGTDYSSPFTQTVAVGDTYSLIVNGSLKTFKCIDAVSGGDLTGINPSYRFYVYGNLLTFIGDLTGINPSYRFYVYGNSLTFIGDLTETNPSNEFFVYGNSLTFSGDLTDINPSNKIYLTAPSSFSGTINGSTLTSTYFTAHDQPNLAGDGTGYTGTADVVNCPLLINW